jgi:hypothetical protein
MEPFSQLLVEGREQVSVHVQCRRDAGVTEPLLDRLRVSAGLDRQGGRGVAKIMDPDPLKAPPRLPALVARVLRLEVVGPLEGGEP